MNRSTFLNGNRLGTGLGQTCVVALLISFWATVTALALGTFDSIPTEDQPPSMGAFMLVVHPAFDYLFAPVPPSTFYYPGYDPDSGILTSPTLFDFGTTWIGISASNSPSTMPCPV